MKLTSNVVWAGLLILAVLWWAGRHRMMFDSNGAPRTGPVSDATWARIARGDWNVR